MNTKAYLIFIPKSARAIKPNGKEAGVSWHLLIPDMRLDIAKQEDMLEAAHYGYKNDKDIKAELAKLPKFGCTVTKVSLTEDNVQFIRDYARQHAGIKDMMEKLAKLTSVPPA